MFEEKDLLQSVKVENIIVKHTLDLAFVNGDVRSGLRGV